MNIRDFWKWFTADETNFGFYIDLMCRWEDEREYEDIGDYAAALTRHYKSQGVTFTNGNPHDFYFTVTDSQGTRARLGVNDDKGCFELSILK